MQNERVVSVNNTTQIDLQGQAASESSGHRHISGTGGQLQFVRGAYASRGGKSFICLASTYEKDGERRSRIVSTLTPGNIVTTPRTDVMYVVTEYGMVNLKGKAVAERAQALIGIAHPDFREALAARGARVQHHPEGILLARPRLAAPPPFCSICCGTLRCLRIRVRPTLLSVPTKGRVDNETAKRIDQGHVERTETTHWLHVDGQIERVAPRGSA